jgi:hypothetical protein
MPRVADDPTSRGVRSHLGQVAAAHHVRGVALVTMRGLPPAQITGIM